MNGLDILIYLILAVFGAGILLAGWILSRKDSK